MGWENKVHVLAYWVGRVMNLLIRLQLHLLYIFKSGKVPNPEC